MFNLLKSFLGRTSDTATAAKTNRPKLGVQRLEDRLTPIVGAGAMLANGTFPSLPADLTWTGVVRVDAPSGGYGSGTLLSTGRHVLTAGHVADETGNYAVTFTLAGGVTRTIRDMNGTCAIGSRVCSTVRARLIVSRCGPQLGSSGRSWPGQALVTLRPPFDFTGLDPAGSVAHPPPADRP